MSISKMVCMADDEDVTAECIVQDLDGKKETFLVKKSMLVSELIDSVANLFQFDVNKFQLVFQTNNANDVGVVVLNDVTEKTMSDVGISFEEGTRNMLCVVSNNSILRKHYRRKAHGKNSLFRKNSDDDLRLGASASPVSSNGDVSSGIGGGSSSTGGDSFGLSSYSGNYIKNEPIGYVGLVNQAMTCYLNSLLQALFMTPEFRNALYSWEFDGKDEVESIPYQLQRLFLNLQTSSRMAVETTELTRSFGWDSNEAWQQHDIQELCRVMFDALEQKFKHTKHADLINRLYEGKMIDYVKCLECSTEKSREDTFLDIPLPVRPFGNNIAYGSVEEALRAFVNPETLDGSNQYFCEKCNKKCDAHKGLKFTKFPYVLTLHLKRFDFDYSTFHRIKLTDKVVFPDTLNLNSFISTGTREEVTTELDECEVKCDDSSTTDSGSALDEDSCQGTDIAAASTTHDVDYQEDDEGIDMSSGAATNNHENEKNRRQVAQQGPYMYELFAIMIHSGSASGGHYYAYIKDFRKGEWFCFNDQSVSKITYDDIRKTYGGAPLRGYYSGAFSCSTNAYMLMYRQIDKQRNCNVMTSENFPAHIKDLLQKMREREESDRVIREKESKKCKLKVYATLPDKEQMVETTIVISRDATLEEATLLARSDLRLEHIPSDQCRLVSYDRAQDTIECSFEGKENEMIGDIVNGMQCAYRHDFLLEIKTNKEPFAVYNCGELPFKVYEVDVDTEMVNGPYIIRGKLSYTLAEYKKIVAQTLDMDAKTLKLIIEKFSGDSRLHDLDHRTFESLGITTSNKLYVANAFDPDPTKPYPCSKLAEIIDQYNHVIALQILLPEITPAILEELGVPPLSEHEDKEKIQDEAPAVFTENKSSFVAASRTTESPVLQRVSPVPVEVGSDQSNSEDSSLSDSDRTLVGDVPDEEGLAQLSVSSMSPCVSSPDEAKKLEDKWEESNWDEDESVCRPSTTHYFKVCRGASEKDKKLTGKIMKVLIDTRMTLSQVKKQLEPYVGVPMDYFKVFRNNSPSLLEVECTRLNEDVRYFNDRELIEVKLGRALRSGEYPAKIYHLIPDDPEPVKFLCNWIVAKDAFAIDVRRSLHDELKRKGLMDVPFERFRMRRKSWQNPGKVYLDDEKFDLCQNSVLEMFVQELSEPETVKTANQVVLFVRQWCPATLELSGFQEVVLEWGTTREFKQKLSELSEIPPQFIDICEVRKVFSSEMSVLNIHNDLNWVVHKPQADDWNSDSADEGKTSNSHRSLVTTWPADYYDDGHLYLYRDGRVAVKQLTSEERKEFYKKETQCSKRVYVRNLYSPRRERGLKIYLEQSKKNEDVEVD